MMKKQKVFRISITFILIKESPPPFFSTNTNQNVQNNKILEIINSN